MFPKNGLIKKTKGTENNMENKSENIEPKLTQEEFIIRALKTLPKPPYLGFHSVFSGFNDTFRLYFGPGSDPVKAMQEAQLKKIVSLKPTKHGCIVMPYDEKNFIEFRKDRTKSVLKKMRLSKD